MLFWPTSALLGQDETIAACFIAVAILFLTRRRLAAAWAVLVVGLFVAKVFLLAVLLAFLFTAPTSTRRRAWTVSAVAFVALVGVTWLFSGTNGISQQLRYEIPYPAFTMSPWSTLLLHHDVSGATAHDWSVVLATRWSRSSRCGGRRRIADTSSASADSKATARAGSPRSMFCTEGW